MDPVPALEAAFAHTGQIIGNISPDQMDASTPCTEWTVASLLEHTTGVVAGLGQAAGGSAPAEGASFDEVAANALQAWRSLDMSTTLDAPQPGTPAPVVAGIQLMDVCGHAWDLAKATGQASEFDPELCAAAMTAAQMVVSDEIREGRFGPAVDAPDASPSDQFAAFLGRPV